MSKKETEFDRIDRMRKLEREAEMEKRKSQDVSTRKKGGRPKPFTESYKNEKSLYFEEEEEEVYSYS